MYYTNKEYTIYCLVYQIKLKIKNERNNKNIKKL